MTEDWQYGFLLFGLLDRTSHRSFRTFHKFENREGFGRDPGFHLDDLLNPYILIHDRQPEAVPYLTADDLPAFLHQVEDFNKHQLAYTSDMAFKKNSKKTVEATSSVASASEAREEEEYKKEMSKLELKL